MRNSMALMSLTVLINVVGSCKKDNNSSVDCFSSAATVRKITNKQAVIKLTATVNPVYIIEQGSIDLKLIPCNFPMEFYQDNLKVIISGEVKSTLQRRPGPCCSENFVITKITR